MNPCIVDLFENESRMQRLASSLPKAFEMAAMEIPGGNPAIGILREHILTGFFINEFGDKVVTEEGGITRGKDIYLCEVPLSIKTVTNNGEVKVLWTVDPLKIGIEISRDYSPSFDIFLVNIYWDKNKDSIFYIPTSVQSEIHHNLKDKYLKARVGTNHRGIAISAAAMRMMKSDSRVLRWPVNWTKTGVAYTPYQRWEKFWHDHDSVNGDGEGAN